MCDPAGFPAPSAPVAPVAPVAHGVPFVPLAPVTHCIPCGPVAHVAPVAQFVHHQKVDLSILYTVPELSVANTYCKPEFSIISLILKSPLISSVLVGSKLYMFIPSLALSKSP